MANYSELERRLILENAKLTARIAIFMQAMASVARKDANFAQSVVKAADQASLNVKWEDLTTAKPA